jgi:hypothetical protein
MVRLLPIQDTNVIAAWFGSQILKDLVLTKTLVNFYKMSAVLLSKQSMLELVVMFESK